MQVKGIYQYVKVGYNVAMSKVWILSLNKLIVAMQPAGEIFTGDNYVWNTA